MKISEHKLKNGAQIIGIDVPGAKSIAIYFGFRTGSRSEDPEKSGISHYLEHMVFKGSQKRPSAAAISKDFDRIGAQVNAATSKEFTYYHIKTIPEYFDIALDVIGDMVTRPVISSKEAKKESGTIIQEMHMGKDNPALEIYAYMEEVLYGSNSSFGRHILGKEKTVKSITAKDLRDYFDRYYVGENAVCVIAGKLPKSFDQKASKYLKRLNKGTKTDWPQAEYGKDRVVLNTKKTDQATLGVVIPGLSLTDNDRFPLEVAVTVLSGMGMMSNRLFTEIREKRGWAYRIWGYSSNESDSGHYGIFGGIKKDKIEESISIIKKEIKKFPRTLTNEELTRAKGYLRGTLSLKYDDVEEVAAFTTLNFLLTGQVKTPEQDIKAISLVTKKEVVRVAEQLFTNNNFYLAIIGPYKNKEKFAKILAQK